LDPRLLVRQAQQRRLESANNAGSRLNDDENERYRIVFRFGRRGDRERSSAGAAAAGQ